MGAPYIYIYIYIYIYDISRLRVNFKPFYVTRSLITASLRVRRSVYREPN